MANSFLDCSHDVASVSMVRQFAFGAYNVHELTGYWMHQRSVFKHKFKLSLAVRLKPSIPAPNLMRVLYMLSDCVRSQESKVELDYLLTDEQLSNCPYGEPS